MPKTKHSNRKVDLANQVMKKDVDPVDTAEIILDSKKIENLTKALPKIKKIKKESVEVESSVTTTSSEGTRVKTLDSSPVNPDEFLNFIEDTTEEQVRLAQKIYVP